MDQSEPHADDDLRAEYDLDELRPVVGRGRLAHVAVGNSTENAFPGPSVFVDLWIAISCGAIPLAFGSFIFFTWYYTRRESLPGWGLLTVLLGCVFFVVGCIHLSRYWNAPSSPSNGKPSQRGIQTLLVAALLLINFPAAMFYAVMALALMDQLTITVSNRSSYDIDEFTLTGPGSIKQVGPVRAGESERVFLDFRGEGSVTFQALLGDRKVDGEVMGYVTGGIGGKVDVNLLPDGKFEVLERVAQFVD